MRAHVKHTLVIDLEGDEAEHLREMADCAIQGKPVSQPTKEVAKDLYNLVCVPLATLPDA